MEKSHIKSLKKAYEHMSTAQEILEELQQTHEEWIEEHSEKWQQSEKGEEESDNNYAIQEAYDALDNATYDLSNTFDFLV